jgi:nucleoside-diphosphate-sugar epimerase
VAGNTVLITGASGLVGVGAIQEFLTHGWDVVALSRRSPALDPSVVEGRDGGGTLRHLSVDLTDSAVTAEAMRGLPEVTHVVFAAVAEDNDLVRGWTASHHVETNLAMLANVLAPLSATAALEHVSILQGGKAYGVHVHPIPIPARESLPRDDSPNFYWAQEDYLKELAARIGFAWTVLRPANIVGPTYGVAMNSLPVIGVYAAICREEGTPFKYPGGPAIIRQAADTALLAKALRWVANSPDAWNDTFNLTNGDVFTWPDLWPAFTRHFGFESGEPEPMSVVDYMATRGEVWDHIVQRHGLQPLSLETILGRSHHLVDFSFNYRPRRDWHSLVSDVKIRQAGFTEVLDTEQAMCGWFDVMVANSVLPAPA